MTTPIHARKSVPRELQVSWGAAATASNMDAVASAADLSFSTVWNPSVEADRTYNFHPTDPFTDSEGRTHLAASCHNTDEEGNGSYVRYYYSDDSGATWTEGEILCPSLLDDGKRAPIPVRWIDLDGDIYCLVDVVKGGGTGREQVCLLAVRVSDGVCDEPKLIHPLDWTAEPGHTQYSVETSLRERVLTEVHMPYGVPWSWGTDDLFTFRPVTDDGRPTEHSLIRTGQGWIVYSRMTYPTVEGDDAWIWANFSADGISFRDRWIKTGIPSANTGTKTCIRRLSDRYVALVNSSDGARHPILAVYSADGLTWDSADSEIICPSDRWPSTPLFPGGAKSGRCSYAAVGELPNGKLIAAYGARGKEVIETATWTPKSMS